LYIDFLNLRRTDAEITNFSKTTFIIATILDKVFLFSSRYVNTEDKKENFDLIKLNWLYIVDHPKLFELLL